MGRRTRAVECAQGTPLTHATRLPLIIYLIASPACPYVCVCVSALSTRPRARSVAPRAYLYLPGSYPAMTPNCRTAGGLADAYTPLTALPGNLPEWSGCDVFSVRYPIIVQNIARYLGNLRYGAKYFAGHVIFVTSPPYAHDCASATKPNQRSPPSPPVADVTREAHYYDQVRLSE